MSKYQAGYTMLIQFYSLKKCVFTVVMLRLVAQSCMQINPGPK